MNDKAESIHFVTGRLAEHALRDMLEQLAPHAGFTYTVDVLPITVAALMSPDWVSRHLQVPPGTQSVLLPGYCRGDLTQLQQTLGLPVGRGPRDLRRLPAYFGQQQPARPDYGQYTIEIIAEINHAPRQSVARILDQAASLAADGADVIDIGCEPGQPWLRVGECVQALRDEGYRVSIDSFQTEEIERAVKAGAELVLSVNRDNRDAAPDWGCEVVVIPDQLETMQGLDDSVQFLARAGVPFRIDPVLEPIGLGFTHSLRRYLDVRQRYPDARMLMGIGNLTEMTDADSAAINVLLLGICEELDITSVLTTQVINWARTSVRECDLARRLVHYAVHHRIPPKHIETRLVLLRDARLLAFGIEQLQRLADKIKDHHFRIFAEEGQLHALSARQCLSNADPFALFQEMVAADTHGIDPSHAFYLGFEMAKAHLALTLGKQYQQDEPLDWGYLNGGGAVGSHARQQNASEYEDGSDG